ncbi:UNVERIFIED_CONTAM: hypothetical protein FKN15_019004 [Acipenser sinensis]
MLTAMEAQCFYPLPASLAGPLRSGLVTELSLGGVLLLGRPLVGDMDGDKNQFQHLIQSLKRRRALTEEEIEILHVETTKARTPWRRTSLVKSCCCRKMRRMI